MQAMKRGISREQKHLMTTILAATTQDIDGQTVFRQFAFADGTVVTNLNQLFCSEHGWRQCIHHRTATKAIDAATRQAAEMEEEPGESEQDDVNPALLLSPAERLEMHIAAALRAGVGLLDPIPLKFLHPSSCASHSEAIPSDGDD